MKKFKSAFLFPAIVVFAFVLISWGKTGHRIISLKTALSFNQEMSHFWDWTAYLSSHASDADFRRASFPEQATNHYIDIDNYPEYQETGKISHSNSEVTEKHGEEFVIKQGTLPWVTLSILDSLTNCFKQNDWEKAAFFAADLGHFVADGHMPFHITRNYDGQFSGNKGIHGRYESAMINEFQNDICYSGKPAVFIENPEHFIFNYLYKNYKYIDSILIADNNAHELAGNNSSKIYTESLWKQTQNYTQLLFAEASLSFASLLYTAWVNAGSPQINDAEDFLIEENEGHLFQVFYGGIFKKSANINYSFGNDSTINISVYDKSGKYIETLLESESNLEPQHIKWQPANKKKEIYFIILKTESIYQVKKISL
ncbi:MAG: hypothetical protein HN778_02590 [Prolixibacteraceae bacterium]|jgi:hypothetical protein|nr:hypothetical protein [Prolixibacteraceae bacterium]MBT6004092.1 hypothetical protein [Prolixibacteraceae bacterium]MBT6765174.1 hypothetical protein [Prolixibacteraceae bacterium]MBT7001013.1 hypothetical protein [Prolixibacteraceae bacterium]MBT7393699.1 hypothetical protein [Prolixibacteraceae bacterium]